MPKDVKCIWYLVVMRFRIIEVKTYHRCFCFDFPPDGDDQTLHLTRNFLSSLLSRLCYGCVSQRKGLAGMEEEGAQKARTARFSGVMWHGRRIADAEERRDRCEEEGLVAATSRVEGE